MRVWCYNPPMLSPDLDDTIVAISTPPGQSGIGIVRLSGPQALAIADRVFAPATPTKLPSGLRSFTTAYGRVVEDGDVVDEVILTVMRGPRTYTTQDVVEISCHGGMVPLRRTLQLVLASGARLAEPGEFTRRAYVFGRIDLAQAEAVVDLINARSEAAQRVAMRQLAGRLSQRVRGIRDQLVDVIANLEAAIDFPDDAGGALDADRFAAQCAGIEAEIDDLLRNAVSGRALREGVRAAIVGRPNVGKSSLMNALLGHERVIVTPIPGTTRDVVEDAVVVDGVAVILADTAGQREARDEVEAAGVQRSRVAMEGADLVLLVLDGAEPLRHEDHALLEQVAADRTLLVVNKADLPPGLGEGALAGWQGRPPVMTAAPLGTGIEDLRAAISAVIWGGAAAQGESVLVTNVRHCDALGRTREATRRACEASQQGLTQEYLSVDIREALDALGEIIGETLTEDIVNRIFETFCIGK